MFAAQLISRRRRRRGIPHSWHSLFEEHAICDYWLRARIYQVLRSVLLRLAHSAAVCRPGQRLVIIPSLAETATTTPCVRAWREWVVEIPLAYPEASVSEGEGTGREGGDSDDDADEEFSNIHMYAVK